MADSIDPLVALTQDVVELTVDNWNTQGNALLLSKLGKTLTERGHDLRVALKGGRLLPFLRGVNEVRVIQHPGNPTIVGVVPSTSASQPNPDLSSYFSEMGRGNDEEPKKSVQYNHTFWAAFSRRLGPGLERTISLEPIINFQDVTPEAADQSRKHRIPRDKIISAGDVLPGERNAQLQKNIREWLHENNIPVSSVLAATTTRNDGTLLSALIAALDREELARVVLPLDVVAKLMSKDER